SGMLPTGLHATITRKATSKRFGELPMKFFLILFIIVAPRIWVKSTKVVNKLKSVQIFITLHTLPFNAFMYFLSRCASHMHVFRAWIESCVLTLVRTTL